MIEQDSWRLPAAPDWRHSKSGLRTIEALARGLSSRTGLLAFAVVAFILAPSYLLTAAPGLTWLNHGADGGDLATAVATWGVPHPTGYPTYVLLGRLFLALPWSDPAYRLTLMSVASMALAGGILGALAARGAEAGRWLKAACGMVVGLSFGLGPLSWSQATIVEVHGLNALFVALALLFIGKIGAKPGPPGLRGIGLGFMSGLALGNLVTFVLLLPVIVAALWCRRKEVGAWHFASWMAAFGVGLSVYLYLPLASHAQPAIDWGDPSTWKGFGWVISGGPYRGLVFGYPLAGIPGQIAAWARLLLAQFGLIGLALGIVGLVFGTSKYPWVDRIVLWIVPIYSIFALGYNAPDSSAYLIPAYLGFAWWIGLGVSFLATAARRMHHGMALLVPLSALIALGIRSPRIWREVDASSNLGAIRYSETVMKAAPEGALILTQGDRDTFPLWYTHFALGRRPDLRLVVAPLTAFDWYRRSLAHTYPDLAKAESLPSIPGGWLEQMLEREQRPVCRIHFDPSRENLPVGILCDS